MSELKLSHQGEELIEHYKYMAENGYQTATNGMVESNEVYERFELKKFRQMVRPKLLHPDIQSVLDYGGGGSDWEAADFEPDSGESAKEYFLIDQVATYEPARGLNQKTKADCVVCMDVLEHVFLPDVPKVVTDLFGLAKKLLIINVACYRAGALLPNGENAHVTIREPHWWKAVIDVVSLNYPEIEVYLFCSESYDRGVVFESFKSSKWLESNRYEIDQKHLDFKDPRPRAGEPKPHQNITVSPNQIIDLVGKLLEERPQYTAEIGSLISRNTHLRAGID